MANVFGEPFVGPKKPLVKDSVVGAVEGAVSLKLPGSKLDLEDAFEGSAEGL